MIVTSYVFKDGVFHEERLQKLVNAVGKEHVVLDLSCRRKDGEFYVVTDRWQKFTELALSHEVLNELSQYCDEFLIHAVDLGADKIVMYNYKDGVLKENTDYTVNVVPGSGPRHLIFSQDGRFGYLINEIANKIMVFKYNEGRMSLIQAIHCVPRHFKGFNAAAAIHLTKNSLKQNLRP